MDLLAYALGVPRDQVITTLRRKNLHYCDARGVTVFDATWADERLVEAAITIIVAPELQFNARAASTPARSARRPSQAH
jgi:hypothetical protein